MGLFVDTVSTTVNIPELGIILTHPTTNFDLSKFSAEHIVRATSLTTAITTGLLNWKKTSGGSIEPNADYDKEFFELEEEGSGSGQQLDRGVRFRDLTASNLTGASPGFTFGKSGSVSSGSWLVCDTVPSNVTGRRNPLASSILADLWVDNQDVATYTVEVYEHQGNGVGLTLKASLTVTSARGSQSSPNVSLTAGYQLAIKVSSGSPRNVIAGIVIKGDT
jgi:hypothetical protein